MIIQNGLNASWYSLEILVTNRKCTREYDPIIAQRGNHNFSLKRINISANNQYWLIALFID